MQIVKTKSECDHVQFLITDTSGPGVVSNPMIAELETLSVGKWCTTVCFLNGITVVSIKSIDVKRFDNKIINHVILYIKKYIYILCKYGM